MACHKQRPFSQTPDELCEGTDPPKLPLESLVLKACPGNPIKKLYIFTLEFIVYTTYILAKKFCFLTERTHGSSLYVLVLSPSVYMKLFTILKQVKSTQTCKCCSLTWNTARVQLKCHLFHEAFSASPPRGSYLCLLQQPAQLSTLAHQLGQVQCVPTEER